METLNYGIFLVQFLDVNINKYLLTKGWWKRIFIPISVNIVFGEYENEFKLHEHSISIISQFIHNNIGKGISY